jgi:S1-C subfamily serine protease
MLRQIPIILPAVFLALITAGGGTAAAQQGERATPPETPVRVGAQANVQTGASPWLVTVEHEVNLQELQRSLAQRGVKMSVDSSKPVKNILTGVVIDRNGHVLTRLVNLNPEAGQSGIGTIKVVLSSGESRPARFIGIDGPTGFSLLEVEGLSVEPAPMSKQPNVVAGTTVKLVDPQPQKQAQKPFRVSSVDTSQSRMVKQREMFERRGQVITIPNLPVIRGSSLFTISFDSKDAPQSSNMGVLMDENNMVVGIPAAANNNIVQAYSAPEALRAAERIISRGGNVPRAWLGVGGCSLSKVETEKLENLAPPMKKGVLINNVAPNTPAAKAGLKIEDVVLTLNGEQLESVEHLTSFIAMQPAGQTIEFGIWRDKQLQKINVTLGKRGYVSFYNSDEVMEKAHEHFLEQELASVNNLLSITQKTYNELISKGEEPDTLNKYKTTMDRLLARKDQLMLKMRVHGRKFLVYRAVDKGWLGIVTVDLPPPAPGDLSPEAFRKGVRVVEVLKASIAERAGVKPDDIIARISGYPIANREALLNVLSILEQARPDSCEMIVRRDGQVVSVKLQFTEVEKEAPKLERAPQD